MPFRLLIADDLEDSADSLAMLMRHAGHEVEIAYDGDAAWKAAEAARPDAVLLDIEMPKMSGYDVCRRIREQPWGKEMLLIAVTGWSQEEVRQQVEQAGFDDQMVKPIDARVLSSALERWSAAKNRRLSETREPRSP